MLPDYYEFICPVKVLCGRKALSNLPYELKQLGASRPLVITDQGVVGAKLMDKVKAAFNDSDIEIAAIFEETPPDSSNHVVNEVAKLYQQNDCDSFVAVGGGSVIDTTKGVNVVVSEKTDDLLKFQGVDRISAAMQPFIAVPTTAGTGSEVTAAAVISNVDAGHKMALMSNKLYPQVAIVDPAMTMTMPAKITAATGMDAMTHAVEAYICIQKNPISDAYASAAIKLMREYLIKAVEDGSNDEARLGMANAALLAGISFSNSMVGIVHAMAHACGGVAHVPHGVANSILLPFGMEYNLEKVPQHISLLAHMLGVEVSGLDEKQKAEKAIEKIRQISEKLNGLCGLATRLRDAGVREDQLEQIATVALNDGALTYNPEEADYDDILKLLKAAY